MKRKVALLLVLVLCLLPVTTAFASGHSFSSLKGSQPILSRGSKGSEVRRLQQRLKDLGYLSGRVDGSYGSGTESAVRDFQRKNGITANGVATLFTQAALYGTDAIASWNNQGRSAYATGNYGIQNGGIQSWGGTSMDIAFDFVNRDSRTVEAICIYYWLDNGNGRLVRISGYEYWQQWYYGCNIGSNDRKHVTLTLNPKKSEANKAHELKCVVGEIAYSDGTIVITMGNPAKPYNNRCYILDGWD